MKIKNKFMLICAIVFICSATFGIIFFYLDHKRETEENLVSTGRTFFQTQVLLRKWIAQKGGVFVPITEKDQPSKYLKELLKKEINIKDEKGMEYTLRNPAFVTREMGIMSEEMMEIRFKITSLDLINPSNAPDSFEYKGLKEFNNGKKELWDYDKIGRKKYFRYMAPFIADESCIKCHQSYKVGDVRGGISVAIPSEKTEKRSLVLLTNLIAVWIMIVFSVLIVIYFLLNKNVIKPIELLKKKSLEIKNGNFEEDTKISSGDEFSELSDDIDDMKVKIKRNVDDLEKMVEGRTFELNQMNRDLEERTEELESSNKALIESRNEAERANHAKSEFLSNMSHELRTPMNGILGFTELLLDVETNDEKKEYLEIIENSASQLLAIINDVLSLSKIEAGKMELKENKINVYKSINSLAKCFSNNANSKGLEYYIDIDKNLDREILCDEHALLQIINNLLSNAIKFTEKGNVKLFVKEESDEKIEIIVRDTGVGINEEKQKHLYESFEQGEHYLTKQYGGTGLGLAIIKKVLELINGDIFVKTEKGKGTEFRVIIPFKEVVEEEKNVQSKLLIDSSINQKLRIISAEDVEINQKLLETILKSEDIYIKKVYNGKELLEELEVENYDLVLMDIQMPIINGIEATKAIRNHERHKNILIIAVSAYAFEENISEMKKAGINDWITKPVKREELINKINEWAKTKNV